ncbi:hypothetical protein SAMN06265222_106319 [Neorhodopirellula lusitana]|uniref:Uncharacterized protein n=1 Tax=Neorhodopirellula lusitana TaxID=445327 RepID=A0ABY1Q5N0_9BACT|nr:hypothetical protein SAMN06265222_106319 [Neorhodopirellula lusitana]
MLRDVPGVRFATPGYLLLPLRGVPDSLIPKGSKTCPGVPGVCFATSGYPLPPLRCGSNPTIPKGSQTVAVGRVAHPRITCHKTICDPGGVEEIHSRHPRPSVLEVRCATSAYPLPPLRGGSNSTIPKGSKTVAVGRVAHPRITCPKTICDPGGVEDVHSRHPRTRRTNATPDPEGVEDPTNNRPPALQ